MARRAQTACLLLVGEGEGAALPLAQQNSTVPGPRANALRAAPLPSNSVASPPPAFATWQICQAEACKSATQFATYIWNLEAWFRDLVRSANIGTKISRG